MMLPNIHSNRLMQTVVLVGLCAGVLGWFVSTVNAVQVTERSIALSSSSAGASNVTYAITFTPQADAGAFVVDFCTNSPTVNQACESPANDGFSVSGAASQTAGFEAGHNDANTLVMHGSLTGDQPVTIEVGGITNPSVPGSLYARIVTYDTLAHAVAYESENLKSGVRDTGGVVVAITDTIGVSGIVPESVTFCVSAQAIGENCQGAGNHPPSVALGELVGTQRILSPGTVSEGSVYTQVSTNAINGVVINLKSSALSCGGLVRREAPTNCDIKPALRDGVSGEAARFGVKLLPSTDTGMGAYGVFQPVNGSGYNSSSYVLNYTATNATGVTSAYGDPLLSTDGAPANNKNVAIMFGASVTQDTPAGEYATDLSLIVTGKF